MAALSFLTRNKRSGVLFNQTDHGLQLARLGRLDEKPLVVDAFTEFPATADGDTLSEWVQTKFPDRSAGYLACYCGFPPADRLLIRDTINTRRFAEPTYRATLPAETAKLPSLK